MSKLTIPLLMLLCVVVVIQARCDRKKRVDAYAALVIQMEEQRVQWERLWHEQLKLQMREAVAASLFKEECGRLSNELRRCQEDK